MSCVWPVIQRAGAAAHRSRAAVSGVVVGMMCVLLLVLVAACPTQASESPLRSWGSNDYGELGLGDTANRLTPTAVGFFAGTTITGVSCGNHSLATAADGALWAWGRNSYGQLGLGDTTSRSSPSRVAALETLTTTATAAGLNHSLALTSGHRVWAWGRNQNGQLGLGDTTNRNVPTEVTALADKSVVAVAASNTHSLALTSDGKLWAWGANGYGQLGLGYASASVTAPAQITAFSGMAVRGVSAGYYHSLAVTADGRLWAWGRNTYGQLGVGDTADRTTPTPVPAFAEMTVSRVAAGSHHTLVITSDGRTWCFGWNYYGQLGLGDTSDRSAPVELAMPGGRSLQAIAAGFGYSMAHASDGTTWGWGQNFGGQLGVGDTGDRNVPTELAELSSRALSVVTAGDHHCLAVLKGNTLPLADDQSVDATTCAPVSITLTGSDGDGDPLSFHLVAGPTHGMLNGDPPSVTYTSTDTHSGSDSFMFKVNDGHADSDPATVSITIYPAATTLYTIDRSGTITEPVILRQYDLKRATDNVLLEGKTIAVKIDGTEVGTGTTNAGGDSTLNWTITSGPATRTITTAFAGDAAYSGCSDDATLTCQTWATKMTGINREGKITAYRILKAWLWKLDNSPVAGRNIAFKLDGTLLGTDNTRSTGLAQIGYTIADGAGAGARTVLAEWAGDGGYHPSSCTNTLTVLKATPYIWAMPRSVPQGGIARLYAYFRRLADYRKQEGKTVTFRVDGTFVADVVTLSGTEAGIARYQYTTGEPPGVHTIRCEFAGDAWVDAGYGEANLTIY